MQQEKVIIFTEQDLSTFVRFPNSDKLYKLSDLIPKSSRKEYNQSDEGQRQKLIAMYKYAMETGTWRSGAPYDKGLAEMKYNQLVAETRNI